MVQRFHPSGPFVWAKGVRLSVSQGRMEFVVNAQYISVRQDLVIDDGTGICALRLNIEFELKCAVGLLGYYARTFAKYYICLGSPIVVDSFLCFTF